MTEEERMKYRVPAWCPVCQRVMKGHMSNKTYFTYGCCVDCFIEFVEFREERWKSGWRPTQEEVDAFFDRIQG